jgi:hypothetical protein
MRTTASRVDCAPGYDRVPACSPAAPRRRPLIDRLASATIESGGSRAPALQSAMDVSDVLSGDDGGASPNSSAFTMALMLPTMSAAFWSPLPSGSSASAMRRCPSDKPSMRDDAVDPWRSRCRATGSREPSFGGASLSARIAPDAFSRSAARSVARKNCGFRNLRASL